MAAEMDRCLSLETQRVFEKKFPWCKEVVVGWSGRAHCAESLWHG